ncbi:MAG: hypothetical protein R3E97_13765 [Candidatus Eisenbacteria bacterium]
MDFRSTRSYEQIVDRRGKCSAFEAAVGEIEVDREVRHLPRPHGPLHGTGDAQGSARTQPPRSGDPRTRQETDDVLDPPRPPAECEIEYGDDFLVAVSTGEPADSPFQLDRETGQVELGGFDAQVARVRIEAQRLHEDGGQSVSERSRRGVETPHRRLRPAGETDHAVDGDVGLELFVNLLHGEEWVAVPKDVEAEVVQDERFDPDAHARTVTAAITGVAPCPACPAVASARRVAHAAAAGLACVAVRRPTISGSGSAAPARSRAVGGGAVLCPRVGGAIRVRLEPHVDGEPVRRGADHLDFLPEERPQSDGQVETLGGDLGFGDGGSILAERAAPAQTNVLGVDLG